MWVSLPFAGEGPKRKRRTSPKQWEFCLHAVLQHQVFSGFSAHDLPCRIQHKCMSQVLEGSSLFPSLSPLLPLLLPSLSSLLYPLLPLSSLLLFFPSFYLIDSGPMREHYEKKLLTFLRSERWNCGISGSVLERTWGNRKKNVSSDKYSIPEVGCEVISCSL